MLGSLVGSTAMVAAVSEVTVIGFYSAYAITAVTLVVFLARTLYRNGQLFLESSFDEPELASAVNQLLVVGFYLLNLGYALLVYQLQPSYDSLTVAFNELVVRLGVLLLSLGVIHLLNMAVFWRIRTGRTRSNDRRSAPLPPAAAFVPPPPSPMSTVARTGEIPAPGVAGTPVRRPLP